MKFTELDLAGAYIVDFEPIHDDRGWFARTWCQHEFGMHGLCTRIEQINVSHNRASGTLRGMHYQVAPHEEAKVISCTRGSAFVAIVDLRPNSRTYTRWTSVSLTQDTPRVLFAPIGFAAGYQTLLDDTEVMYLMSTSYEPSAARGLRYDDPLFAIRWPLPVTVMSERDQRWSNFVSEENIQ